MKKKGNAKRLGALLLSFLMAFGSVSGAYAVEDNGSLNQETVMEEVQQNPKAQPGEEDGKTYSLSFTTQSGIEIVPDKDSYKEGETVVFTVNNTSGNEITDVYVFWSGGTIEFIGANGRYLKAEII